MHFEFHDFLSVLPSPVDGFDENNFFARASVLLQTQLEAYLNGVNADSRTTDTGLQDSIRMAKRLKNVETDKHFWDALDSFRVARDSAALSERAARKPSRWLKFVNVIERLQQYSGSQVFPQKNIRHKRQIRLYLAVALTWEHLRYLAGNDDDYSPSGELLNKYGVELETHED